MGTNSCRRLVFWIATGLSAGACLTGTASAADLAPMPTKAIVSPAPAVSPWTFNVTPYAWLTSLNGSTTVKGRTTDVDASFIDILNHTKIPVDLFELAANFEARKDRFSIFADFIYMKVGVNGDRAQSHGVDAVNLAVGISAGLKVKMVIAELAATYALAQWGPTSAAGSGTAIDIYGGARGWWQKADANFSLSGTVNIGDLIRNSDGTVTASGSVGWIDPMVGLRLRHQFAPGWNFVAKGDVGGFGVGSKFSWEALAAVNYDFYVRNNVTWSGMIGYKALYVDYSKGDGLTHYEYKMTTYGPVLGVSARF
jgi:hypothetical protein